MYYNAAAEVQNPIRKLNLGHRMCKYNHVFGCICVHSLTDLNKQLKASFWLINIHGITLCSKHNKVRSIPTGPAAAQVTILTHRVGLKPHAW
jgi:hypothetical protein